MSASRAPRTGPRIHAVVFDLYGTLLHIREPCVHRAIPRTLGIRVQPWMEMLRGDLLTRAFDGPDELVRHVGDHLAPESTPDQIGACVEAIHQELASVEPIEHAHCLLGFLRRRGYKLGLLSNLTSVHKQPLTRLGLDGCFDALGFSCDRGLLKPDRRFFRWICEALDVDPSAVLLIGDSYPNDVRAARDAGMHAAWVSAREPQAELQELSELAWRSLDERLAPLLDRSKPLTVGGYTGKASAFVTLPDGEQGRYNLVGTTTIPAAPIPEDGTPADRGETFFCKRFLYPEAAHVEGFVHSLHALAGLPSCDVAVTDGVEPVLLVSRAPGEKFAPPVDLALAEELGRHCAAGYIFSNADLRPRNAFVERTRDRVEIRMVDLEHCLFNLAIDVDGLSDPLRPDALDRLSAEELAARTSRRVLSDRAIRRAMGTFLELESLESPLSAAFRKGWCRFFQDLQSTKHEICTRMEQRAYTEPFLIVGTRSYRRAFARVDVDDIRSRIEQDPVELYPRLAAVRCQG